MSVPAPWLVAHRHWLPHTGAALDVACGRGRHALWLARHGFSVIAIDRDAEAVDGVAAAARSLQLPVEACVADLEDGRVDLGHERFSAVVVFNYLHRPLFPQLLAAIRPGGVLVYETFTLAQAHRGRPRNPDFLLEPGELLRRVAPLTILASREGEYEEACLASVVARKGARKHGGEAGL